MCHGDGGEAGVIAKGVAGAGLDKVSADAKGKCATPGISASGGQPGPAVEPHFDQVHAAGIPECAGAQRVGGGAAYDDG